MGAGKADPPIEPPEPPASERLESWKEIANYLKRGVTTVQRWEKQEGLPVHRHLHDKLGTVYAYKLELDAWWQNGRSRLEQQEPEQEELAKALSRRRWLLAAGAVAMIAAAVLVFGAYFAWQRFQPQTKPPAERVMLAVLPFTNLSGNPDQEYLSDGLTEEMITQLAQIRPERLGVIARTSVFQYKGNDKGIEEIGRELGVEYILEGSVRRRADHVRISTQLIHVKDQTHVWAESYDRNLSDMLVVQSQVARAVAENIRIELKPEAQTRLASTSSINPAAYEAYLKGLYYEKKGTYPGAAQAIQYYEEAIKHEPAYARAYVGLANAAIYGHPYKETMPTAKAAALHALEISPDLAEAHAALGLVQSSWEWNWAGAEKSFKRALELDPNSAFVHHQYSIYLAAMGRFEEALAQGKRSLELDPISPQGRNYTGRILYFARQYDKAIEHFRNEVDFEPNNYYARFFLGIAYEQKGMYEEAITEIARARELIGDKRLGAAMAQAYASSGYSEALRAWAELWAGAVERGRPVQALSVAVIYARAGEKEKALQYVQMAFEEHSRGLIYLNVEPAFDPLRPDPRFQALLRRMNFPA